MIYKTFVVLFAVAAVAFLWWLTATTPNPPRLTQREIIQQSMPCLDAGLPTAFVYGPGLGADAMNVIAVTCGEKR